jgi:hypothetical protein
MKFLILGLFILAGTLAAEAQEGIELGELNLVGTACRMETGALEVTIEEGKLRLPTASILRKASGTGLARGTCNFALPIQLAPDYKLVLKNLETGGDISLAKGTSAQADLEIFVAGQSGNKLQYKEVAKKKLRKTFALKKAGTILESECGASLILRGNSALLLQGTGTASSAMRSLELEAEVLICSIP